MLYKSTRSWCLVAFVAVAGFSCKKAAPAPPPAPSPVILPKPEPPRDPSLPPAPKLESKPPGQPPVSIEIKPPAPKPAEPKKQRARVVRKKADVKPQPEPKVEPAPAEPAPAGPPAVTPRLGQILSPAEVRELQANLQGALDRVRKALAVIEARPLTNQQKETLNRIRTFASQAEQAREQDLVSAANLAERADVLSRDLLERLR